MCGVVKGKSSHLMCIVNSALTFFISFSSSQLRELLNDSVNFGKLARRMFKVNHIECGESPVSVDTLNNPDPLRNFQHPNQQPAKMTMVCAS